MMLLWAIWQLDHNRWQLAIRAIQRAFRTCRTAQTSALSKLGYPPLILTLKPILSTLWVFLLTNLLFGFLNPLYVGTHQVNISAALAAVSLR